MTMKNLKWLWNISNDYEKSQMTMKDLKFLNDDTKGRKIKSLEAQEQALSHLKMAILVFKGFQKR